MTEMQPALDHNARVHVTSVIDRRVVAPSVISLGFRAPELARAARGGQYVMAVPPSGEAAAVALGIYEAHDDRISLLFFLTGKRTRELGALRPGDELSMFGPLGNGFELSKPPKRATIVAGGVGIASVLLAAEELLRAGSRVELLYGARSSAYLVDSTRFARLGCHVAVSTDDGSAGHHGFVTQLLEQREPPELLLACGPSPMLRAVAASAARMGVRAQLSLEETFACGVGGCWGCVVPLSAESAQAPSFPPSDRGGSDVVYARICKEGPVFWSDELRW
ncbi:MAG: dihydroorotate dehydrogenase electron transfer subunit [Candidatus Tumulicola sp.]